MLLDSSKRDSQRDPQQPPLFARSKTKKAITEPIPPAKKEEEPVPPAKKQEEPSKPVYRRPVVRNASKKHTQPFFETEDERVERMMRFHRIVKAKYNDISKTLN